MINILIGYWLLTTIYGVYWLINNPSRFEDKEDFTLNSSKTFSFTGLNIAVNSTDYWTVKILTPTWVTNPTAIRYAIKIKTLNGF